ncbi:transcription termination/antitermination protein NusG [Conchiformibius steedae DSM 2580]|uniref:Transcription termination/antitermination protein NusG n=1 Tax=Conchiformibius steedae DSM 2580 TaxID=1121352 RepID=A0AAE9HVR0_9NEIS|nr:transcription termination/antitermination protein NusG [Conchiformibius steedae]QMT33833.1 transcription termination/antitermination protein NusG [Conchiformibius steedae]URD68494.1 transcription termination/antitermination protein NusG [Conchiformibius steedae DSM 2580]
MSKRWYVVQAYSGFEKNVQKTLKERIAREGMEDYFGQILVPVEEVVDIKNGRKTVAERKFFPGYVLIEMEMTDSSWHLVKSTPRINGFIGGTAHRPLPISQREVDNIMAQVGGGASGEKKPKPRVEFEVGQQVRVNEGPFADFNGAVEFVDYERNKLRVTVQIFGRETPVELEFGQVEKL